MAPGRPGARQKILVGNTRGLGAPNFIKNWFFGGFWGSRRPWGYHQSTRDEKIPWGYNFRDFGTDLWRFHVHFLIHLGSLRYANSSVFDQFFIKPTFEPITTPLKWILADAAWKVSASVENFASIRAGKYKTVPKHSILLQNFVFHDLKWNPVGFS